MESKSYTKADRYYHQKQYAIKNKDKLNEWRVVHNHKQKYGDFLDSIDKVKEFKKNKKLYLNICKLDKNLVFEFLKRNTI